VVSMAGGATSATCSTWNGQRRSRAVARFPRRLAVARVRQAAVPARRRRRLGETLHEPTEAERHLAGQALQAAPGAVTYARVDVVPTSDGPRLMELELIEPDLGLRLHPPSIEVLAKAILAVSVRSIC
ncbi:MAG: hypothetical protein ABIT71_14105, partial [Vicinamibacteraceae bacterium]